MDKKSVLFEDNHVLAVVKPHGMLCQPAEKKELSLTCVVREWIKRRDKKPGNVFLEPVHRLDRPVGGIVLFAKTSKALSRLNEQMRQRTIQKWYRATVAEKKGLKTGKVELYFLKKKYKTTVVTEQTPGAKKGQLIIESIQGNQIIMELLTGRYHQIRATLGFFGAPIIGDEKYGGMPQKQQGIALQHWKMLFQHPVKKTAILLVWDSEVHPCVASHVLRR